MKLKYLVANKPKLTLKDKEKLRQLEEQLQEIRLKGLVACEQFMLIFRFYFHLLVSFTEALFY